MSNGIDQESVQMELQTESQVEGQSQDQSDRKLVFEDEPGYQVLPPPEYKPNKDEKDMPRYCLDEDRKKHPIVEFVEIRAKGDHPVEPVDRQPWTARYLVFDENDKLVRIVLLDAVRDGPRVAEEEDKESDFSSIGITDETERRIVRWFVPAPKNENDWNHRVHKRVFTGNVAELPDFEDLGNEDTNIGWCVRAIARMSEDQSTGESDDSAPPEAVNGGGSSKTANGSADGDKGSEYPSGWIVNLKFYKDREAAEAHVGAERKSDEPSDNKGAEGGSGQDEPQDA